MPVDGFCRALERRKAGSVDWRIPLGENRTDLLSLSRTFVYLLDRYGVEITAQRFAIQSPVGFFNDTERLELNASGQSILVVGSLIAD